jgi:hypothetical protein
MNKFPYEQLSDDDFENLVIRVCKELLGIGCKTFSPGKDGAKDSWFTGTAERFPSQSSSWSGVFNIQAKHTTTLNASCSDNSFLDNQTSILNKEIGRLKEIMFTTPFDNYILFTNRKLTGGAHPLIVKKLKDELGISNAEIIGREQLDTYLTDHPFIANQFGLYKFISPLRFYEKDLREVIIVFAEESKTIAQKANDYVVSLELIDKETKNELNGLSKEYFDFILFHSNKEFENIRDYLRDPKNDKYMRMYGNTVSDLQAKIILERSRFVEFEHLIEYLIEFIVTNNEDRLIELRSIVRVFIHFMYFNCDIGKTK